MNEFRKDQPHAARPRRDASGRRPLTGQQPCEVCGLTVARVGAHPASDGGRGFWKHTVRGPVSNAFRVTPTFPSKFNFDILDNPYRVVRFFCQHHVPPDASATGFDDMIDVCSTCGRANAVAYFTSVPVVESAGYVKDGEVHETFRARKVIVEFVDRDGGYWLSCDEDGQTREHLNPALIVAEIRHADAVAARKGVSTVTTIDWLNVPAGFTPPAVTR